MECCAALPNPSAPASREVRGLRFGVPRAYFFDLLDPQVAARFDDACERLTAAGADSRGCRDPPHEGDRADLPAHRAARSRRLSRHDARKPAAGLHAERAPAARDGALHPRRGLRTRAARAPGVDAGSQRRARRTRWAAAAVAPGAGNQARRRDGVDWRHRGDRSATSRCG